jgi:hypothetical protein
MDPKDLTRLLFGASVITCVGASLLAVAWDVAHARGLLFGGLWSIANLWVLKGLLAAVVEARRCSRRVLGWMTLKLPLLYGVGAGVLLTVPLSVGAAIVGFHIPLAVILAGSIAHQNAKLL